MRTVFDRLAHASIMRLNTASMDKVSRYHTTIPFHATGFTLHSVSIVTPVGGADKWM